MRSGGKRGDRWVAEKCGVTREYVNRLRNDQPVTRSQVRTGQDGKTRTLPRTKPEPNSSPRATQKDNVTFSPSSATESRASRSSAPASAPASTADAPRPLHPNRST